MVVTSRRRHVHRNRRPAPAFVPKFAAAAAERHEPGMRGYDVERLFTKAANRVAHWAGMPATFIVCCAVIVVWAVSGPLFGFSDTWQLIINTGTTIITFLMVFLIQNTQNRDGAAVQAKLDELVRVGRGHNHFIGIEHLTESEVEAFRKRCETAASEHDRKVLAATKSRSSRTSSAKKRSGSKAKARGGSKAGKKTPEAA